MGVNVPVQAVWASRGHDDRNLNYGGSWTLYHDHGDNIRLFKAVF